MMRSRTPFMPWHGFILIFVGLGLLAREFGWLPADVHLWHFWPIFVIGFGLSGLRASGSIVQRLISLAVAGFGALLLASNLHLIAFSVARLWPILLILAGLGTAFAPRGHRRFRGVGGPHFKDQFKDPWKRSERGARFEPGGRDCGFSPAPAETLGAEQLQQQLTCSGVSYKIESQSWKGGAMSVTLGGAELDLRHARLAPEGALLDLQVLLGGIEIRVPDTWHVICEVAPSFGSAEDSTRSVQGTPGAPQLRITGTAVFGSVSVRN